MDLVGVAVALIALAVVLVPRVPVAWPVVAAVAAVPVAWPAVAAGAVSVAITALHPVAGRLADGYLMVAEVPPLLLLAVIAVRRAPARQAAAAGVAVWLAVSLMLLRALWPGDPGMAAMACAGWSPIALLAVAVGLYLRAQDDRRRRAVRAARAAQRLVLARDLHDFVAHDVSGMLVQAQAARMVAGTLPPHVADALRRIEEGAERALSSLDRTVHMLHEDAGRDARAPVPGLDRLPRLVADYASAGEVALSVDPALEAAVSREASATIYRVVTEALTNARRHAPAATAVEVAVARKGDEVHVSVRDDGGGHSEAAGRGGFGLAGLAERVAVLGGSLTAGPDGGGWRVTAVLPLGGGS